MTITEVLGTVYAWLAAPCSLGFLPAVLAKPVAGMLASIGYAPESRAGVLFTLAANCYFWLFVFRTFVFSIGGRYFGYSHPDLFSWLVIPGWRPAFRTLVLPIYWWYEEMFVYSEEASARLAGPIETISRLYKPGHILVGRYRFLGLPFYQPVSVDGSSGRHLVAVATTGAGKTNLVRTLAGLHNGNGLYIDPRADLAIPMLRRMGQGGKGIVAKNNKAGVLDPSNLVPGHPTWHWNPFDEIFQAQVRARKRAIAAGRDPELAANDATVEFAQKILEGLIIHTGGDKFFTGAARDFCLSVILWMVKRLKRAECTLEKFYELISVGLPHEVTDPKWTGFDMLLRSLMKEGGSIASGAAGIAQAGTNTGGSVMITIREALAWLKRPALCAIMDRSDFTLEELHPDHGSLVLFVTCKLSDIRETYPAYFRLITLLTLAVFEDINTPTSKATFMCLEEFGNLGYLPAVESAAPYARGFGLRLLCIVQNIGQLVAAGYRNPDTFFGNVEACWWFKTEARDNLEYLEKSLGKRTIKERIDGPPRWLSLLTGRPARFTKREREVMTCDQIRRILHRGNVLVTCGGRAMLLRPEPYFEALPVCFYDRTQHRETLGRRMGRCFFESVLPDGIASASTKKTAERPDEPGQKAA